MKINKIIVNFILDKSGSMESVKQSTISGFNEYVNTLKKDKKSNYEFTLTLFDTVISNPIISIPIKKVDELTNKIYTPDGMTALYDAVCSTIKGVKSDKKDKILVIIMTDGEENSSKEYTQIHMKDLIKECEKKGNWTFVYLGANQDSYKTAHQYGFSVMNTSNYNTTGAGVSATMRSIASNTVCYSAQSSSSTSSFFTKEDQDNLGNVK